MTIETDEKEHSLEMQLPFLYQVFKANPRIKIVPIMVGALSQYQHEYYARKLESFIKDPETLIIVSSDFCHWGQDFNYFYLRS